MRKILIPSELLEPIITKTIGEIIEHFALGMWSYEQMVERIESLNHFVDNCGAIHCGLAVSNTLGMILAHEGNKEELRIKLKKVADKHYTENI